MKIDDFKAGDKVFGYIVKKVTKIEMFDALMIKLEHQKTCAKHIHIQTKDTENTFGVFFPTTPEDSTGVAHILEHIVLCGSKKFKARDPFFSMLTRSLSTFMNALTASDWTMYPFSTQNKKDYYNLMDVYLDAVFFPNLEKQSFMQEGWRLEIIENKEKNIDLEYKGVVYNEMKGAMSSCSQVMGQSLLKALYPDTAYRHNSGGDPLNIPDLTWEGLKNFHNKYYHVSNAYFYTYGSFDLKETLLLIEEKVFSQKFKENIKKHLKSPPVKILPQPRWQTPKKTIASYPFLSPEDISKKYQACIAWLTCDIKNSFEVLVLTVLEQILLSNSASPLRKALIDSNLGSSLSDGTGFHADNKDTMFVCGLKDIAKKDANKVKEIIFLTIEELADKKIKKELIDSAIHQIEFHRKEITNTPYPFGIKLLLSFASTMIHDGDPIDCINIDKDINKLKTKLKTKGFLENKLRQYFLDNSHHVFLILEPEKSLEQKRNEKTKEKLGKILRQMKKKDIEKINKDAQSLKKLQERQEDLTNLPTLELSDIVPQIEIIKPSSVKGVDFSTCYNKAAGDIIYFTCPVGTGEIPLNLFSFLPFFSKSFTNSGTKKHNYEKLVKFSHLYTGGISMTPLSGAYFKGKPDFYSFLALQGKALEKNVQKLFDLIALFVHEYSFHDLLRLQKLLLQYEAGMESSIVSSGHRYAMSLASRHISKSAYVNELWHGISQYQFIKEITKKIEASSASLNKDKVLQDISAKLTKIADIIFKKSNIKPAIIGNKACLLKADKRISDICNQLSDKSSKNVKSSFLIPDIDSKSEPPFEGWSTNTSVSFTGQAFETISIRHKDSPAIAVISKMLRALYLHREIREKGGAYGGFASYNIEEGIFCFGSYRDPYINRTLDVYKNACKFIAGKGYEQTDIKEAVLQICSEIDKPDTIGPASIKAFYRRITKLSDNTRKKFKDSLLDLDKKKIRYVAEKYFLNAIDNAGTIVISNKENLDKANHEFEKKGQKPLSLFKI